MEQLQLKRPLGMGTNASYVSDSLRARIFFGSRVARHRLVFAVAGLFFLADIAQTELIGTSICGCQPATYTFTLDFGLTCRDGNVAGPGINDTACLTEIRGQKEVPPQDLVPVTVQNIQIFELDQNKKPFSQSVRVGTFQNGSNFTYTSVISTMTSDLNAISLPRGLQLVITGINSKEEPVVQTYAISYTNDCGVFPVLKVGQTAGWTIFSDLGDPPTSVCPLAPSVAPSPSTSAPNITPSSSSPSIAPSNAPTITPGTSAPNVAPSISAPNSPSGKPTLAPNTSAPAGAPITGAPYNAQTSAPACPTTNVPTSKGSKSGGSKSGGSKSGGSKSGGSKSGGSKSGGSKSGGSKSGGSDGIKKKEIYYGQMQVIGKTRYLNVGDRNSSIDCPDREVGSSKNSKIQAGGSKSKTYGSKSGKTKGSGKAIMKKSRISSKGMIVSQTIKDKSWR